MNTQERILTNQDDVLLAQILTDFRHFEPLIEKVEATYNELKIGTFNQHTFKEIIENGSTFIVSEFQAEINRGLDESGVKHPVLRKSLVAGMVPPQEEFEKSVKALREFQVPSPNSGRETLQLRHISFTDDEGFFISENDKESILQGFCRTYLETEQEYELFELVNEAANLHKRIKEHSKKYELDYIPEFSFKVLDRFFMSRSTYEINGKAIKSQVREAVIMRTGKI